MRWGVLLLLILPTAAAAPEQVHLGFPSGDPASERSILWLDMEEEADPHAILVAPDGTQTKVGGARVEGPSVGYAYEARLTGLAPDATYRYRVGEREFALQTPAADAAFVTFVALGDMGVRETSAATVATIGELAPDFVLHAGDISYGEGNPVIWKQWFDLVEPVAGSIPWVTALGNHETYTGVGVPFGLTRQPSPVEVAFYKQRFGLPEGELWYSFDWGPVHVVALDTFSARDILPAQLAWLEDDLAANADAPWTIAFLHEPPYSSNEHGDSDRVQELLVPLLEGNGADLVIGAHDHAYERSYPMRAGRPVTSGAGPYPASLGVMYVVTGGGGESLYSQWREQPDWSAAREASYHVVEVTATRERLELRYVPTAGGGFRDSFVLDKALDPGRAPAAILTNQTPGAGVAGVVLALALALALVRRS